MSYGQYKVQQSKSAALVLRGARASTIITLVERQMYCSNNAQRSLLGDEIKKTNEIKIHYNAVETALLPSSGIT